MKKALLFLLPLLPAAWGGEGFKEDQLRYPRVREAYKEKEAGMKELLEEHGIDPQTLRVHLRAYKKERELELWGRNASDTSYKKLRQYEFCAFSGGLGPKRQQGDYQIPEGFYHIDRFNPASSYHLSLGLNYPNPSDRILGVQGNLGGDIFIHGDCVTIGCIPITDAWIKELYIFCVEAKDKGQDRVPVRIFPARMDELVFERLLYQHEGDAPKGLWKDLKKADMAFKRRGRLSEVSFRENGRHELE